MHSVERTCLRLPTNDATGHRGFRVLLIRLVLCLAAIAHSAAMQSLAVATEPSVASDQSKIEHVPIISDSKTQQENDERSFDHLSFDGSHFQRILSRAMTEPVFVDIDTGRFFTPPMDVVNEEARKKPIGQWNFTEPLLDWVQDHGADLAAQTDGKEITLMVFGLRVGSAIPSTISSLKISPKNLFQKIAPIQPDQRGWATMQTPVVDRHFPFLTREGRLGSFWIRMAAYDGRGPNAMEFDYQLIREPDLFTLTSQRIVAVPEPRLLDLFSGNLNIDIARNEVRLKVPGSRHVVEMDGQQVIVRDDTNQTLRFARLCTGFFDACAKDSYIEIYGHGKQSIVRRHGTQLRIELDQHYIEAERLSIHLPELRLSNESLKRTPIAAPAAEKKIDPR